MQKFPNLKNPNHFLATLGGIGLSPYAPGTAGTIFGGKWTTSPSIARKIVTMI